MPWMEPKCFGTFGLCVVERAEGPPFVHIVPMRWTYFLCIRFCGESAVVRNDIIILRVIISRTNPEGNDPSWKNDPQHL